MAQSIFQVRKFSVFFLNLKFSFSHSYLQSLSTDGVGVSLSLDPGVAYLREVLSYNNCKREIFKNCLQEGSYLIGLDPIWNVADNRLNYINSLKVIALSNVDCLNCFEL